MIRWHSRVAIAVPLGWINTKNVEWIPSKIKERMTSAYLLASNESQRITSKNKRYYMYDHKVRFAQLDLFKLVI